MLGPGQPPGLPPKQRDQITPALPLQPHGDDLETRPYESEQDWCCQDARWRAEAAEVHAGSVARHQRRLEHDRGGNGKCEKDRQGGPLKQLRPQLTPLNLYQ